MSLNDKLTLAPTICVSTGNEQVGEMQGRVVYIHPERRFYVVEFRATVTGETWRECFYFRDRAALKYLDTSAPRLPGAKV